MQRSQRSQQGKRAVSRSPVCPGRCRSPMRPVPRRSRGRCRSDFAPAPQQVHLREVDRVDVRVPEADRALQRGLGIEQPCAALDREHVLATALELRLDDRRETLVFRARQLVIEWRRCPCRPSPASPRCRRPAPRRTASARTFRPASRCPNCPITAASPDPLPNQPGSMWRLWDQANIHGMARNESTSRLSVRDTGREPICIRSMTSTGVTAWK